MLFFLGKKKNYRCLLNDIHKIIFLVILIIRSDGRNQKNVKKKIKFDKNSYGKTLKTKKTTVLKLAGPNSVFIVLHMGRILAKSLIKPP